MATNNPHVEVNSDDNNMFIRIHRPIYTQTEFDKGFEAHKRHRKSMKTRMNDYKQKCSCVGFIYTIFPFLKTLRDYTVNEDLVSDLISGLTVGVMHVPQGMAYGILANLPPIYGLYVSFFPPLLYFFFGTSKHISMGTFAVVSLITGLAVDQSSCNDLDTSNNDLQDNTTAIAYFSTSDDNVTSSMGVTTSGSSDEDSDEVLQCKVGVAAAVAFIAGVYQLAIGLLRMGWVTIYLSEPLTRGFTTAAAVYVFTSQIKHVFGISTERYNGPLNIIYTYIDFFSNISSTNFASLILATIAIVSIYLVKEYVNPKVKAKIKMPFPIELVWVILGTVVSVLLKLEDNFDVRVVGDIPQGLPSPSVPSLSMFNVLYQDAIGISVVAFANNFAMAKLFARKQSYDLDSNTEFIAYGLTNIGSSFFSCYTSAASLSRSLVQEAVGGRTQVAALISCAFLLVIFYGVGPLFEQLPNCVLAAIVIVNLKGMFLQFWDLKKLWKISKYDFWIWLVIFSAVCILDVGIGLYTGIIFAMLTVIFRTQSPYTCLLGRVPHTDIYKDISVYSGAREIPGIKIYRFESSLYYANAEHFLTKLFHKSGVNPRDLKQARKKLEKKHKKQEALRAKQLRKRHVDGLMSENDTKTPEQHQTEAGTGADDVIITYVKPTAPISHVIIDCSNMSYIDAPGISTLSQAIDEYASVDVNVLLAGCKAGIREQLKTANFFEKIDESILYLSIHDAVLAAFQTDMSVQQKVEESDLRVIDARSVFEMKRLSSVTQPASTAHQNTADGDARSRTSSNTSL